MDIELIPILLQDKDRHGKEDMGSAKEVPSGRSMSNGSQPADPTAAAG